MTLCQVNAISGQVIQKEGSKEGRKEGREGV